MKKNAEAYLERVKKIDFLLRNKVVELERMKDEALVIGSPNLGERVSSSRNLHSGANAIGRCIDIEAEIEALRIERRTILKTLEILPADEYEILYRYYFQYKSIKEISSDLKKSYEWVWKQKKKALKMLQSILNEKIA